MADAPTLLAEDCMCRLLAGHPELPGDGLSLTLNDRVSSPIWQYSSGTCPLIATYRT
jgi:hypothetical protein